MGTYHYINLTHFTDPFDFLPLLSQLSESIKNPFVKINRIIFSNFATARQFLEQISDTPWKTQTQDIIPKCDQCNTDLDKNIDENQVESQISIKAPKIITSNESAYEIERVLRIFGEYQSTIKTEILCSDTSEALDTMKYFLQDKFPDLCLTTPIRCSLVHNEFEIDTTNNKKTRKKNRKPPAPFQRFLKISAPHLYPNSIGNDYYGNPVFSSYLTLFNNMLSPSLSENASYTEIEQKIEQFDQIPLPPSPLKYYDLQTKEGEIELRFQTYLPLPLFMDWMNVLKRIIDQFDQSLEMFRCSLVYDHWETELEQKSAKLDRFFFSWNDIEFAYTEKNYLFLSQFSAKPGSGALYLKLTPFIEDSDFRIQLLESATKQKLQLM
ncbi:hypothetical protein NEF87_000402 [Candidatus Lokiarchaeum ossiferum]|uniref:Uncharacterized protein n=1 Tax=Candidatus Lokiarchaeum ossiferum TaxID=2951803 RepID=A0ABY6HKR8_9ARCH|nr:hypothetical protein NEF87_000402 [Candidatus Lokiarchaeum sp. B-35]